MREQVQQRANPELRELIIEASLSLARLDAERLEELALSCRALNREMGPSGSQRRVEMGRKAREAAGEMAVFAGVLDATRANLDVLNRLRESRDGRLEYGGAVQVGPGCPCQWTERGSGDGNH